MCWPLLAVWWRSQATVHIITLYVSRYSVFSLTCVLAFACCLVALAVLGAVVSFKSASDSRSSASTVHVNISTIASLSSQSQRAKTAKNTIHLCAGY